MARAEVLAKQGGAARRGRKCKTALPEKAWDEELHGDQFVYDAEFEMNETLVPWEQERRSDWTIERWGFYM